MRAAILQGSAITIDTWPDPEPNPGQLLVSPIATGICGSDLHYRERAIAAEAALPEDRRGDLPRIVPGHEFSARLVEAGPNTETPFRPGDRLVALPFTHSAHADQRFEVIGLSPVFSGGLATLTVIDAERAFAIPEEVPDDLAALTEPLAVGLHAVNLATRNRAPNVVLGCGPVGLAVILGLIAEGRGPILAADFSPQRRRAAAALGADFVIDPSEESPYQHWRDLDFRPHPPSPLLERTFRGLPPGANIFDCVGAQGLLDRIVKGAPQHSHVITVGVCAHEDKLTPREAIVTELTLEFSFAYRPEEFQQALAMIAANPDRVRTLVTSHLPLSETAGAFDRLARNPEEIKVLIDPHRD
ncbi:MAG: zinc-binding dehydrogenase [Alphaproteobacteria bacterium]|nr:zinc-binding dehydrogenase [Alphaproteobacteria bacterium]MCB9928785.1 zinc-binding dehydrogenase [Alphaproteobacteria bacterium]